MPRVVKLTAAAAKETQDLLKSSVKGYVELHTALFNVSQAGLVAKDHIAVVDHKYDVHRLEPASPSPDILIVDDTSVVWVVKLLNPKHEPLSNHKKEQLAWMAASAVPGMSPFHVYAIP